MGLGALLITLPLWSVTSARRILGLPLTVTLVCVVPLAGPAGAGPTTRKPVDEVIHLDSTAIGPGRTDQRFWLSRPFSPGRGR